MAIKFLNSVNADSGVLYVDAANNRVGIGTASPDAKLDVNGIVRISGTNKLEWNNANVHITRDGNAMYIASYNGWKFHDMQSSTERLRITQTGNVGIGTTSPAYKLDVSGTARINSNAQVLTINGTNHAYYAWGVANVRKAYAGFASASTTDFTLMNENTGSLILGTNGSTKAIITSTGNVGIGTTSPSHKLQVAGNIYANAGQIYIDNGYYLSGGDATSRIYLGNDGGDGVQIYTDSTERMRIDDGGNVGIGTTSPDTKLHIHHTSEEVLRIDSGTTGAIHFFEGGTRRGILGYSNGTSISTNADANDMILRVESGKKLHLSVSGTARLTVDGSNVGIGTTSPDHKLTVYTDATSGVELVGQDGGNQNSDSSKIIFNGHAQDNGPFIQAINTSAYGIKRLGFFANRTASDYTTLPTESMSITNTGNVGIGTTSPTSKLHVSVADTNEVARFEATGTGEGHVRILGTAPVLIANSSNAASGFRINVTGLDNDSDDLLRIQDNGSTRLNIKKSGNLGIGTTSPSEKLHVDGVVKASGFTSANFTANTQGFSIESGDATVTTYRFDADKLRFYSGNFGEIVSIKEGGNVGIGTTSPTSRLFVGGSSSYGTPTSEILASDVTIFSSEMSNDDYNSILQLVSVRQSLTTGRDSNGFLGFSTIDDSNVQGVRDAGRIAIVNEVGFQRNSATALSFWTNAGGTKTTAATEKLRITSAGNVGIGTTSPAEKLHIQADTNGVNKVLIQNDSDGSSAYAALGFQSDFNHTYHPGIYLTSSSNTAYAGANSLNLYQYHSKPIGFVTNNILRAVIAGDGNVGIGTTSPAFTSGSGLEIQRSGTATLRLDSGSHATELRAYTNGTFLGQLSASYLDLGTNSSTRVRIDSTGNVGIGTTSPEEKLHVSNGDQQSVSALFGESAAYGEGSVRFRIASTNYMGIGFTDGTSVSNNVIDAIAIQRTGNVGIGATAPDHALHVKSAATGNATNLKIESTSAYGGLVFFENTSNRGTLAFGNNGNIFTGALSDSLSLRAEEALHLGAGGNNLSMTIATSGNVGIGTTSPSGKLHIYAGAGEAKLVMTHGTTDHLSALIGTNGGGFAVEDNNYFAIWHQDIAHVGTETSLTERMRITSAGNVGIGTTSPSEKLEVDGDVKADNFIGGNEAGIYSFSDTVDADSSEDIFSISNDHGAQAFRVTFVCSTSGYSVAKTFEVVHQHSQDPIFAKVIDTGAFSVHDFDVSFTNSNSNTGVTCEITNNSTTVNANIVTTVFLGGSPTDITVTAL